MKLRNTLSALLLFPTLVVNGTAFGNPNETKPAIEAEKTSASTKALNSITDQLRTVKLKKSFNILNYQSSGFNAGLNYEMKSETSFGDNYSGIDVWQMNLNYVPSTLAGSTLIPSANRLTEVTFIQQFKSRTDSLVRVPYDPIQKLPINSERALKLNVGDFVAFRAPMTLSLGKGLSETLSRNTSASFGLSLFTVGEFDVHIFRMPDNYVRVKLFALREKGITASLGLSVFGINTFLLTRVLNIDSAEVFMSNNRSELFSLDYIFNLNNADSKAQYDQVIGQKYRVSSFKYASVNPFTSDEKVKDLLFGDLESVQNIVQEDAQKPLEQRRIIRLMMGENETESFARGLRFNFKVVKAKSSHRTSESRVTIYNIENQKKNYLLSTKTKELNGELFWLWGVENRIDSGLLVEADANFSPQVVVGLQTHKARKELNLSKVEFDELKNKLSRTLPAEIVETIEWPKWPEDRSSVKDARIEQDIFFNPMSLQSMKNLTVENIEAELKKLIKSIGKIESQPMGTSATGDYEDYRLKAYQKANYLEAYEHELIYIPNYFAKLLNENETMESRLKSYESLQAIPLFNEIGATLALKLIPREKLAGTISYRFLISAKKLDGKQSYYPTVGHQENINVFLNVLASNSYIVDRSFSLSFYLNEKGIPYTLSETVIKSK